MATKLPVLLDEHGRPFTPTVLRLRDMAKRLTFEQTELDKKRRPLFRQQRTFYNRTGFNAPELDSFASPAAQRDIRLTQRIKSTLDSEIEEQTQHYHSEKQRMLSQTMGNFNPTMSVGIDSLQTSRKFIQYLPGGEKTYFHKLPQVPQSFDSPPPTVRGQKLSYEAQQQEKRLQKQMEILQNNTNRNKNLLRPAVNENGQKIVHLAEVTEVKPGAVGTANKDVVVAPANNPKTTSNFMKPLFHQQNRPNKDKFGDRYNSFELRPKLLKKAEDVKRMLNVEARLDKSNLFHDFNSTKHLPELLQKAGLPARDPVPQLDQAMDKLAKRMERNDKVIFRNVGFYDERPRFRKIPVNTWQYGNMVDRFNGKMDGEFEQLRPW
ncbi:unnamed protein product [Amoebophrya sp. A120]|nr:unnamed protein product [Amoebophrya sp. A120]|eukprot:GSA120T00014121001.1